MKNCLLASPDEISNVINDYTQTFALLKTCQISSLAKFNQLKAKSRASSAGLKRQMLSKSNLTPNINLQRFPNFFTQLGTFAKTRRVKLNIVPTLVLPPPVTLVSTDPAGNLKAMDGKTAFAEFLAMSPKPSQNFPVFVFKPETSKLEFIYNKEEMLERNRRFNGIKGIFQYFLGGSKISPLLRAVADKTGNFKFFIIEKIKKGTKQKIRKISLFSRLKQKKLLDDESFDYGESLIINDSKFSHLMIHPFKVTDLDLQVSVSALKDIVEKFTGLKFSSITFDFIKDSSGKWFFFSCPCARLLNCEFSELFKSPRAPVTPLGDFEQSSQTDSTVIIQTDYSKTQEPVLKFQRSNSYFTYSNIIDNYDESLGDKFRRVMNKIDHFRSGKKIPNVFASKSDLIIEYKSRFNEDQTFNAKHNSFKRITHDDGNLRRTMKKSESKASTADSEGCEKSGNKRNLFTSNCVFDSNTKLHLRNLDESVGRFDILMVNLKKTRFPTINFPQKYGENFIEVFLSTLEQRIMPNDILMNNMNELKCPGISSILNCKYSIEYEKRLIARHHPLKIDESTYTLLSDDIILTLKCLQVHPQDLESIQALLKRLHKYLVRYSSK